MTAAAVVLVLLLASASVAEARRSVWLRSTTMTRGTLSFSIRKYTGRREGDLLWCVAAVGY